DYSAFEEDRAKAEWEYMVDKVGRVMLDFEHENKANRRLFQDDVERIIGANKHTPARTMLALRERANELQASDDPNEKLAGAGIALFISEMCRRFATDEQFADLRERERALVTGRAAAAVMARLGALFPKIVLPPGQAQPLGDFQPK